MYWVIFCWSVIIYPGIVFSYFNSFDDLEMFCRVSHVLGCTVCLHWILLHDAIILVKHFFIFHLKNPTAVQDDFWKIFINVWIFGFSLASQIIYQLVPGREQVFFYICVRKMPVELIDKPLKRNTVVVIVSLSSAILHLVFWTLKKNYKYFLTQKYENYKKFKLEWQGILDAGKLFSFATHAVGILFGVVGLVFLPRYLNSLNPRSILDSPNYFLIYFQDFMMGPCAMTTILVILLQSKPVLRQEIKNKFLCFVKK